MYKLCYIIYHRGGSTGEDLTSDARAYRSASSQISLQTVHQFECGGKLPGAEVRH